MEHKATSSSYDVARYYDKQKAYRAAVLYYNEVIRQQPGSPESEKSKKRIEELRAKLGDKVLQTALEAKAEQQKAEKDKTKPAGENAAGQKSNASPVLPPDTDSNLPPPPSSSPLDSNTSLDTDTSLGGGTSLGSGASSSPEQERSAKPAPSSTPAESPTENATSPSGESGSADATAAPTP